MLISFSAAAFVLLESLNKNEARIRAKQAAAHTHERVTKRVFVVGTMALDPTFGSFNLLKLVSH
jgi:hypothetical protein